MGAAAIAADRVTATLWTAPTRLFEKLTSEWNSHLAVHHDAVARTGTNFHAVVHAQPPHLTLAVARARLPGRGAVPCPGHALGAETIVRLPQGIPVLDPVHGSCDGHVAAGRLANVSLI